MAQIRTVSAYLFKVTVSFIILPSRKEKNFNLKKKDDDDIKSCPPHKSYNQQINLVFY